jgi:hypothetical protein
MGKNGIAPQYQTAAGLGFGGGGVSKAGEGEEDVGMEYPGSRESAVPPVFLERVH